MRNVDGYMNLNVCDPVWTVAHKKNQTAFRRAVVMKRIDYRDQLACATGVDGEERPVSTAEAHEIAILY